MGMFLSLVLNKLAIAHATVMLLSNAMIYFGPVWTPVFRAKSSYLNIYTTQ